MTALLEAATSPLGALLMAALAFGDTLIGVGFFVFGEVAFLTAGALWAQQGLLWPALLVVVAAWLGDVVSYALGRRFGPRLSLRLLHRLNRRRHWRRAALALQHRGGGFVILSRLLGPTAWVTPFVAGTLGLAPRVFLPAAGVGVLLGVGQFVIYGALGLEVLSWVGPLLQPHLWAIALITGLLTNVYLVLRNSAGSLPWRGAKALLVAGLLFASSNVAYFFVLNPHGPAPAAAAPAGSVCALAEASFTVSPGPTALHLPQPVNVIVLSEAPVASAVEDAMTQLGWQRNQTFSHDQISFGLYLRQLLSRTPPVSEMYLNARPADSAYQLPGTLKTREHIRWWHQEAGLSLGAISRDDEIAVKYYKHLPVLLHDIDPHVDRSRALLAAQVGSHVAFEVAGYAALGQRVGDDDLGDYQTDGLVLVLTTPDRTLSAHERACLRLQTGRGGVPESAAASTVYSAKGTEDASQGLPVFRKG